MLRTIKRQMKRTKKAAVSSLLTLGLITSLVSPTAAFAADDEDVVNLRLLETTDIHVSLVNYDYYQDKYTDSYGLIKTANLIKEARAEEQNNMLFDNGDLIQGNPLGTYVAKVNPLKEGEVHPAFKVMNEMGYDVGNIGNHEFNYGLDFLGLSLSGSDFPHVNANIYYDDGDNDPTNDKNYFTPYLILDKKVVDEDGEEHSIKVGVIGFAPPQIMDWDKDNLKGKVIAKDIVKTAEKYVPQMKAEGADVVVAIAHSGIGTETNDGMEENATYDLSKVDGIDTILFGHSHGQFPGPSYASIPGADIEKGTLNGVPATMPGYWGSHLGVVDLKLELKDGKWSIIDKHAEIRGIKDADGNPTVEADQDLYNKIKDVHEATLAYVRGPVGETTAPINSYFAQVADDPSVQIVSNAQKWYVENAIEGTEYDGLPVLSAAAPFKAGTRKDPNYYTDIAKGDIAILNVADLYLYDNTLKAVLLNGSQLREWIEMSAGQFNTINPNSTEEQPLVNMDYRSYNFDVLDGVNYQIDVTKEARYSPSGELINPDSHRVINLTYNGEKVTDEQKFVVATNNYRAGGGGHFPGFDGSIKTIIDAPDQNRQAVINYIREKKTINPSADSNWTFAPVNGDVKVTFESSPNAQKYAKEMDNINYLTTLDSGFAKYSIDLSADEQVVTDERANDFKYVVKSGDTLGAIGAQYGVHWKKLAEYNNIKDVRKLMPGQEIYIPVPEGTDEYNVYLVKKGDTLGKIAAAKKVNWKDLAAYNKLDNPHFLTIGQEIKIPK